ncbi:hypothetical protein PPL_01218 [Heterostelium album PN500]|uniref:Uncharacterized protein n=1 Tax=Heterostelium pallidum (strain ATCC 26659 / Pp 5 / PN500) TaxID=670386 RepID=D3AYF8_HETP5|nr:hypothetical protein PPL_01218 [Heterostelium album PN500]EFA85985.1 hypothetical protein PPL_01218 [Heterostelium album PN500]|eukprot:XP_020438091.1 hypothetical protein PPL_01218 [Heterostelium album PN500]
MVKSFAQALDLKNDAELIEEYKKYHKSVWVEVKNALKSIGITKMKIFLVGNHLFMYYEAEDDFSPERDFQRYTDLTPRANEWDLLMRKFQQKISEAKESDWWAPMEEVFDLNCINIININDEIINDIKEVEEEKEEVKDDNKIKVESGGKRGDIGDDINVEEYENSLIDDGGYTSTPSPSHSSANSFQYSGVPIPPFNNSNNNNNNKSNSPPTRPSATPTVDTSINFELPSSATVLHSPFTNSTMGSVHVHQSSSDEVSDIISKWRPETVFIELCRSRAGLVLNSMDSSKMTYYNNQQQSDHKSPQRYVETFEPSNIYSNRNFSNSSLNKGIDNDTDGNEEEDDDDEDDDDEQYEDVEGDDENEETTTTDSNPYQDSSQDDNKINSKNRNTNNQILYYRHKLAQIQQQQQQQNKQLQPQQQQQQDGNNSTTSSNSVNNNDTDADDEYSNEDDYSTPNTTTPPTPVDHDQSEKGPSFQDIIKTIKQEGLPGLLHVLMAEMIRKAGNQSKVGPGAEFITAFIESKKIGAKIVLGDRLVEITLQRVWNSLTRWEKIKFVFCLCMASFSEVTQQDIDALKNSDDRLVMELLDEFKEKFPSVVQTIVTERDQYMAARLRLCPGKKIVAVVGKGHVNGIIREWNNYQINLHELESPHVIRKEPQPSNSLWIAKWATLILIPIASALYLLNKRYWHFPTTY